MATTPDSDLVTYLDAQVGALTIGTNLFAGKPRAIKPTVADKAVFVLSSGGPEPQAFCSGTSVEERDSSVSVRVRSDGADFSGGQTLARLVRDTVHHSTIAGYKDVSAQQAEPIYIGEDDDGHHEWSVNVTMKHEQ
jgi:hypothetical protein